MYRFNSSPFESSEMIVYNPSPMYNRVNLLDQKIESYTPDIMIEGCQDKLKSADI